ncbi:hypothetical protein EJB05_31472 [Eragrostis curvula]|uniref:Uncharacterized protein n=1 Tax=Eragrostis curvula TaxID=38414 RepID=A0A5J9UDM3_9POAL|nr:hypothetical protein EJB05_31472 [Eragrostis curvula]
MNSDISEIAGTLAVEAAEIARYNKKPTKHRLREYQGFIQVTRPLQRERKGQTIKKPGTVLLTAHLEVSEITARFGDIIDHPRSCLGVKQAEVTKVDHRCRHRLQVLQR